MPPMSRGTPAWAAYSPLRLAALLILLALAKSVL
jgi:hypothetical protein